MVDRETVEDDYKQELTNRFAASVEYLNSRVYSGRLDEWQGLDMTIPQIKTLVLLERMGHLRMGNISTYLGGAPSATTAILDRLVEKGMVERVSDPNDRRVVLCQLTVHGRAAAEQFWRIGRERIQAVVNLLELEQLETAVQVLELIARTEKEFVGESSQSQSVG